MTNSIMFLLCVDHSLRTDSMHALPVRKPAMQLLQRSLVVNSSRLHPGENLSAPQLEIMDIKRGGLEGRSKVGLCTELSWQQWLCAPLVTSVLRCWALDCSEVICGAQRVTSSART